MLFYVCCAHDKVVYIWYVCCMCVIGLWIMSFLLHCTSKKITTISNIFSIVIIVIGIIHFAGTSHGDAEMLCNDPFQYQVFIKHAMPLYLKAIQSFQKSCPHSIWKFMTCNITNTINIVKKELKALNITVSYNAGRSGFDW